MTDGDDVLTAARTVVRRVGLGAMTLAAVAREAGISRATMYRRYASKESLVAMIVARELDTLERLVRGRLRFADEPRETIHMLVREVLDYNADNAALQAALRIDGSTLTPWLIRSDSNVTLVDIVTERALPHIAGSPLAAHLRPNPQAAVEFMVSVVYSQLLSPARHMTHAEIASYVTTAVYTDI